MAHSQASYGFMAVSDMDVENCPPPYAAAGKVSELGRVLSLLLFRLCPAGPLTDLHAPITL